MRLIFAIPGDLSRLTGGYGYGRQILARLPEYGINAVHCQLPASFPDPSPADLEGAVYAVNEAAAPGDIVLIDGLAYGAFSEAAIRAIGAPILALCHHPLGLEAGLEPERSHSLIASETKALALAARVIVTSAHTARILSQDFGVPAARIAIAPPGTEPAPRAIGSGAPLSLLAIGSITPRKAFGFLIEALAGFQDLVAYANQMPPPDFTRLAPVVVTCAEAGDPVAKGVLRREAQELAHLARLVIDRLRRADSRPDWLPELAFTGSILEHVAPVRDGIVEVLRRELPALKVVPGVVDPTLGALWRARKG